MSFGSDQYRQLDATALADQIRSGTVSAQQVLEQALQRVPFTQLANFCGTPGISLPMGFCANNTLPAGVQLTAKQGQEGLLLQVARQLEASSQWHTLANM